MIIPIIIVLPFVCGYYRSNYYSNPHYSSRRDYQDFTYLHGSRNPTITKDQLATAALAHSKGKTIESEKSFSVNGVSFYWGIDYLPDEDCHSRGKRQAQPPLYTFNLTYFDFNEYFNLTDYNFTYPITGPPNETWFDGAYPPSLPSLNFTNGTQIMDFLNDSLGNLTSQYDVIDLVESYLPKNFTNQTFNGNEDIIKYMQKVLPPDIVRNLMGMVGGLAGLGTGKGVEDYMKALANKNNIDKMLAASNGTNQGNETVQVETGCTQSDSHAVCTRSIDDFSSTIYSYVFTRGWPHEVAWECEKGWYCCEWECCKRKDHSVGALIALIIMSLLTTFCCCAFCCLCVLGKKKENEMRVDPYPSKVTAYFIAIPPRVAY